MSHDHIDPAPIRDFVESYAAERHCPSLAWGVLTPGAPATTGGVGGVTEHTVYRIASMTKSFSAAATLLLRDDGVLRLDDRVTDHAPELAGLDRFDSAPVTIRDLLAMTSGLPTDDPWADRHLDLTDDELDDIVSSGPVFARPAGNTFEYSNLGYGVLGRVVRRACGRRIQDVITDRLLVPLGMTATTWTRPDHDDWARPMRWIDDDSDSDRFVTEADPLGDGVIAPMGGLWTSVADLATWIRWLSDAFPARHDPDDGPLSRASRREMQSSQRYIGHRTVAGMRMPYTYGFGLVLVDDDELGPTVTHSGGLPGYGSNMRWLPGRGIGIIALANSTYAPMLELTSRMLALVAEQDLIPPMSTPPSPDIESIGRRLVSLLGHWHDGDAADLFTRSLVLDDDLGRRERAADELIAVSGELTITSIEATGATGGTIRCSGSTGRDVTVSFLLAPRRPLQIQSYTHLVAESPEPAS